MFERVHAARTDPARRHRRDRQEGAAASRTGAGRRARRGGAIRAALPRRLVALGAVTGGGPALGARGAAPRGDRPRRQRGPARPRLLTFAARSTSRPKARSASSLIASWKTLSIASAASG